MAVNIGLLALPLVLTIYFIVTQYSDRFVVEQNISYFDVQNNWLGRLFLDQKWLEWFNRFMDFAFWGMAALVVLILVWAVSSVKVSFKNHYAQQSFTNFMADKKSWHGQFFVVLGLKASLVVLIIYSVLAIVGKIIPQLAANISLALQVAHWPTVRPVVIAFITIVGYQFVIATCIKTFKHLRAG